MTEIRVRIVGVERMMPASTVGMEIHITSVEGLTFDDALRLQRDEVEFRLIPVDRTRRFEEER